jgi:hypothetical protein
MFIIVSSCLIHNGNLCLGNCGHYSRLANYTTIPCLSLVLYDLSPVPDLPLGVLKHRALLARGPIFLPNIFLRWIFAYVAQVRGLITELSQGLICPQSGTVYHNSIFYLPLLA